MDMQNKRIIKTINNIIKELLIILFGYTIGFQFTGNILDKFHQLFKTTISYQIWDPIMNLLRHLRYFIEISIAIFFWMFVSLIRLLYRKNE